MLEVSKNICRVCLDKNSQNEIFNENSNNFADKIMYCASVQITKDDPYTKFICNQCLIYLDIAYHFRTVCETTDTKLRSNIYESNEALIPTATDGNTEITPEFNEEVTIKDDSISNEMQDITKNKVGRHIAKKNAGKCPKRYQQINDENLSSNNLIPQQIQDNELKIGDDIDLGEPIPENEIPVSAIEMTVVAEEFVEPQPVKEVRKKIKHKKRVKMRRKLKVKKKTKIVQDISPKDYQCTLCSKSFPFRSHLIRHMMVHNGIRNYVCKYCDNKFKSQYNLDVHVQKHTGDFPIICSICDRGFSSPSLLKRHMNAHTRTFNYQCRYCSKKFLHKSSLNLHEEIHRNRPSYSCDICFKIFSYTNSLAAHKKTHLGLKPHKCNICCKTFTKRSSLNRHITSHSELKEL